MFNMVHNIQVGAYRLGLLSSVSVRRSVYTLADTAEIVLPASVYNRALGVESKLKRGDKVLVNFGYEIPTLEFAGYLQNISTNNGSITLQCEDNMYHLRKALKNKELDNISLQGLLTHVLSEVNSAYKQNFTFVCDYKFSYGKFTIHNATAFDVLNKIQEETQANIYLKGDTLHIHPVESTTRTTVYYDFALNVEENNLKYMRSEDKRIEVIAEGLTRDGKKIVVKKGTTGGDVKSIEIKAVVSRESLEVIADNLLKKHVFTGYEGSIKTWLEPYCEPTDCAVIIDREYPARQGKYFITAVTTTLSENGGVREVELGVKLDKNGRG